ARRPGGLRRPRDRPGHRPGPVVRRRHRRGPGHHAGRALPRGAQGRPLQRHRPGRHLRGRLLGRRAAPALRARRSVPSPARPGQLVRRRGADPRRAALPAHGDGHPRHLRHHGRARGRDQPRDPSRHGGIGPPARLRGVAPAHRRLVRLTWRCHPVTKVATWLRKQTAGVVALALMLAVFVAGRPTFASDEGKADLAGSYAFKPMAIALPGGAPQQTIRKVNQADKHIDAWISSVGAAIALHDLDGHVKDDDLIIVDTRTDQVIVTPAPGTGDRYEPFALGYGPLPMNHAMAPMGVVPGDFNDDARTDLLVYWWGRTPTLHLQRPEATRLDAQAFEPVELVPN